MTTLVIDLAVVLAVVVVVPVALTLDVRRPLDGLHLRLVLSRYGARPLDFSDVIVELTAVHFHYAGFVGAVVILCLLGRLRESGGPVRVVRAALVVVLVATPLTAAGITFEPALGALGAVLFAAGLTTASVVTLGWVVRAAPSPAPALLALSSASVIAAMTLAVRKARGAPPGAPLDWYDVSASASQPSPSASPRRCPAPRRRRRERCPRPSPRPCAC